jgi:hypothetical protein
MFCFFLVIETLHPDRYSAKNAGSRSGIHESGYKTLAVRMFFGFTTDVMPHKYFVQTLDGGR